MKRYAILLLLALSATPYSIASAAEPSMKQEAVHHYAAMDVKDAKEGFKLLHSESALIANVLKSKTLDGNQLEKVHEISYTLGACVEKIAKEKATDKDALAAVDEAVQKLHSFAENHDEKETRAAFAELQTAIKKLGK